MCQTVFPYMSHIKYLCKGRFCVVFNFIPDTFFYIN